MTTGQNSTLNYDPGSKFHVELWPRVRIPHWIVIPSQGHNSTFNHDSGSQFNVEFRPRVIFKCGIKTRGNFSTLNHDPGWNFNVESWPGITFQRGIMTRGHNSTWNYDPGSKFHVESWPRVTISHWIVIPIPGHNLMLNHDSGSIFNVESRPGVIIQRGIKTWGSQFNGGPNFIRRRGRYTMTPCLGVAIQHEKSVESWAQPVESRPHGLKFNGVKIQSYTGCAPPGWKNAQVWWLKESRLTMMISLVSFTPSCYSKPSFIISVTSCGRKYALYSLFADMLMIIQHSFGRKN